MYENSQSDNFSPFLTDSTPSAPGIDNDFSDNSNSYLYGAQTYGALPTASNTGRTGYDPRLPVASDILLIPDSPNTRHPRPPKQPAHSACFLKMVVLLCIGAFVLEIWENNWKFESFDHNPMIGPSAGTLIRSGAKLDCLIEDHSESWRIFTPMWLHAGIIHIVANMGAVIQLGFPLEREHGWKAIGPLYMASGIIGTLCSILFLPNSIMVGASGAVFGLLGASWSEYALNIDDRRNCNVFWSLLFITIINLLIGTTPLLDNFAHTGGMISGFIWGLFLLSNNNNNKSGDGSGGGNSIDGFMPLLVAMVITVSAFVAVVAKVHLDKECSWCQYINCIPTPFWSCSIDAFYGPCQVEYLPAPKEVLNITCATGISHYYNNITTIPDQSSINKFCNSTCGDICWDGH
jgi:membrane associated rhomboid family serine protease